MNLREIIEAFQNGLIRVCLWGLAALAACYLVAWLCRSGQRAVVWWRSLRAWLDKIVFISLFTACILIGGTKLNNPPLPQTPLPQSVIQTVTDDEIVQGYRLESVTTNDAVSYAMPTNGVAYAPWSLRGGRETHFPLDLGDFAFPFGTGVVHRLDVLSGGMVESLPRPSYMAICAGQEWASLIPGESGFWWADAARSASAPNRGTVRAKLLTWEDVYANRDRTGPYSAQIELREDGGFTTRSNNVESVYRRVPPFDWDDDGLENSVDPDPYVAGPDAHGTNAEWYNTVCSNVLEATAATSAALPPELTWRESVNSNAYYFVDVVTETGPAPIYFTGDHESRLGNPVVVALAGVTNHVPLLIGIDYAVTSTVPFTVSYPMEYMYLEVETNESCRAYIRWPLYFVFTESIGASNRVYTVTVEPYDPGGVFEWDDSGGGVPMRGGCNCVSYGVNSVWFTCSSGTCGSGCVAHGSYLLERASFSFEGGECRCGFDDPPPDSPPSSHEPNDPPSLTITFSKPAVIFEDTFLERPGMPKPKRSTRVRLTIDAYGGSGGGTLTLSGANMDKLVAVNGNVTLPYNDVLAPGASYHATGVYEGVNESDEENDVVVQGSLVPNYPYNVPSPQAQLTSVKVALEAEFTARDNPCQTRHTYGVGERVRFDVTPALSAVELKVIKSDDGGESVCNTFENEFAVNASTQRIYTCPIVSITPDITVSCSGSRYRPMMKIVEPSHVVTQSAEFDGVCWPRGECGEAGLRTRNYIAPFYVSFQGIAVSEIPCNEVIPPTGYFTNLTSHLTHGVNEEAGLAMWIKTNNYWTTDNAFTTSFIPNWSPGTLIWKIPIGWHRKDPFADQWQRVLVPDYEINTNVHSRALLIGGRTDAYLQKRTIQGDGTFVTEKFGYWISRTRWCHIMLGRDGEEGETVQWFHLFD